MFGPGNPLHPGIGIALRRLTMTETEVAQAIVAGELVSPQKFENVWLFAIRITGTGTSFRDSLNEHVYRPPEHYLTPEFLARCNGLPVVWLHPPKGSLDTQEFIKRIVGTVVVPYIAGDEVWGIAKIYDEEAAGEMASKQLSTSPAVVFRKSDGNTSVDLTDGSTLLIEGRPSLLDHIAICEVGVWDKGGPPKGIITETTGVNAMPEENTEDTRRDEHIDNILKAVTGLADSVKGLGERVDAMHKRMDDDDKRRDARRHDDDDDDDKRRRDDDDYRRRRDDKMRARHDAEESELEKEEGEGEEEFADRKRRDAKRRKDDDDDRRRRDDDARRRFDDDMKRRDEDTDETHEKRCADARKRFDAHRSKRRDDDDDDDRRHDDDRRRRDDAKRHRADSATVASLLKTVGSMPKPMTDADYAAMATEQARADEVYTTFGKRASPAMQGETPKAYRVRLLSGLREHSAAWKDIDLAVLPDNALDIAAGQIYADAMTAARSPDGIEVGTMRMIASRDSTGREIRSYVGDPSAWMSMFRTAPRSLNKPLFKGTSRS